jgi:predicted phage tail protein
MSKKQKLVKDTENLQNAVNETANSYETPATQNDSDNSHAEGELDNSQTVETNNSEKPKRVKETKLERARRELLELQQKAAAEKQKAELCAPIIAQHQQTLKLGACVIIKTDGKKQAATLAPEFCPPSVLKLVDNVQAKHTIKLVVGCPISQAERVIAVDDIAEIQVLQTVKELQQAEQKAVEAHNFKNRFKRGEFYH